MFGQGRQPCRLRPAPHSSEHGLEFVFPSLSGYPGLKLTRFDLPLPLPAPWHHGPRSTVPQSLPSTLGTLRSSQILRSPHAPKLQTGRLCDAPDKSFAAAVKVSQCRGTERCPKWVPEDATGRTIELDCQLDRQVQGYAMLIPLRDKSR